MRRRITFLDAIKQLRSFPVFSGELQGFTLQTDATIYICNYCIYIYLLTVLQFKDKFTFTTV